MKKIFSFLFLLATMVAVFIFCNSCDNSDNYTRTGGVVVKYISASWTDPGWYKCDAVYPNGDTLPVFMAEADFLNNKLPINGTISINKHGGLNYFSSNKPYDMRKIPATALRFNKKPFAMAGLYECWVQVPSGDEMLAYIKETDYLQNSLPVNGYLSMVPGGGSKYFYLVDTTKQKE